MRISMGNFIAWLFIYVGAFVTTIALLWVTAGTSAIVDNIGSCIIASSIIFYTIIFALQYSERTRIMHNK